MDNATESTAPSLHQYPHSAMEFWLWAVISCAVLSLLVTVINLTCLVIIVISPNLRRPNHMAVAGLLLAHLIQGLLH